MVKPMKIDFVKLGINGEGIGYYEHKPVFCPGVLPNETAEVRITEKRPSYYRAECVKILKEAKTRRKSTCAVQQYCGGCALMHMDYAEQLAWKKQLLEEAVYKYANVKRTLVRDIRPSKDWFGYRNQCKVPLAESNGKLAAGMYQPGSNRFQTVHFCKIHDPLVEETKSKVLDVLNAHGCTAYDRNTEKGMRFLVIRSIDGNTQVSLITGRNKLDPALIDDLAAIPSVISLAQSINTDRSALGIFGTAPKILAKEDALTFEQNDLSLSLSPEAFYQLNRKAAMDLYAMAVSKIDKCDTLVEAYCGIGLMSMMAKDKAKEIFGIESVPSAVNDARKIAEANSIHNIQYLSMDAADGLKRVSLTHTVDTLLVDPPRSGMDDAMLEAIVSIRPKKIIYISCNPATLGKNLKELKHYYQVRTIIPYDLFPMTPHVESITVLERG